MEEYIHIKIWDIFLLFLKLLGLLLNTKDGLKIKKMLKTVFWVTFTESDPRLIQAIRCDIRAAANIL